MGMRQVGPDPARGLDEIDPIAVMLRHAGRDREDIRIEDDVLGREADLVHQNVVGALGDRDLLLERIGLPTLIEGHDHDRGAMAAHDLGVAQKLRLPLLERDRIHHRLALQAFEAGLDHSELGGIHHDRNACDVGLRRHQIEEGDHGLFRIEQAFVHVHVDDLGAVLDLIARDVERARVVARSDELAEPRRAGDVGALADIHERNFRRQREILQARQAQPARHVGYDARRLAFDRAHDGGDVGGRGAAAAADDVDEARRGELADQLGHEVRTLVVAAEFVGQPGVRIGTDQGVGDARDLRHVGAHLLGSERAVQSDRYRRGVTHRVPERRRGLPGQQTAREIRNGAGDHHRQAHATRLRHLGDRIDGGLGVERVEDGLDQQQIGTALDQSLDLLRIGGAQLVEGDGTKARIGHVGRNRGGPVGRPDGAGHETRTSILGLRDHGSGPGELGAFTIELARMVGQAVVGLRDRGRGEGVGRDDVGTGPEIGEMNVAHRVGLG